MSQVIVLIVQAMFALIGLHFWSRRVLTGVQRFSQPQLVLDVWGPLGLVLPMLTLAIGAGYSLGESGRFVVGGPLMCGILAIGSAAMAIGRKRTAAFAWNGPLTTGVAVSAGCAALILLLGAARDLTVWMGQCSFAVAAVLLWMNSPDVIETRNDTLAEDGIVGGGLSLFVLCSLAQSACLLLQDDRHRMIGAGIALIGAAIAIAWTARLGGADACLRVGSWGVAYGVLFGLGVLSLAHLLPHAWLTLRHQVDGVPTVRVAHGFGRSAGESAALLAACGIALAMPRIPRQILLVLGVVIVLMTIGWTLVRVVLIR